MAEQRLFTPALQMKASIKRLNDSAERLKAWTAGDVWDSRLIEDETKFIAQVAHGINRLLAEGRKFQGGSRETD